MDYPPDPAPSVDWREARELYRQLRSIRAVARELGVGDDAVTAALRRHGVPLVNQHTRDPATWQLYIGWRSMIRRCSDPKHRGYRAHGASGIGVVASWREFPAFREWSLRHGWRLGRCLVRSDPHGDHSPRNCRWVSRSEMLKLRTRTRSFSARPVRAFGEEKSAWSWSRDKRCTITYIGLMQRLRRGWPAEAAITYPPRSQAPARLVKPRPIIPRKHLWLDWKRIVALHLQEHLSPAAIARVTGYPISTLFLGLQRRGVLVAKKRGQHLRDGPLYTSWFRMRRHVRQQGPRCAKEWEDYEGFREWSRSVRYRRGQGLVRIDLRRGFTPENCRFVPRSQVMLYARAPAGGTRRPRYRIRAFGKAKGLMEWSRDSRCEVTASTISKRMRKGWRAAEAISTPPLRERETRGITRPVQAFGVSMGIRDWERDPRCRVTANGLRARLDRGMDPAAAITTRPWHLKEERARRRQR